jgi:hypothetical protein
MEQKLLLQKASVRYVARKNTYLLLSKTAMIFLLAQIAQQV